jgi:hypothetical protein
MLKESGLTDLLGQHCTFNEKTMRSCISALKLIGPKRGTAVTYQEAAVYTAVRVSVEWCFGNILKYLRL